jgi:putative transposase
MRITRTQARAWNLAATLWARVIVDERDLAAHIDYMHVNPVKHGHMARAADWPWSSFHRFAREGVLHADWASSADTAVG